VRDRNNKNITEITGNDRTKLILQPLFSLDSEWIETPEKTKIAPGVNAVFSNSFLALQNKREYLISRILFQEEVE